MIAAAALVKRFGPTLALDGFDLNVGPGEIVGFVGPNGAGKSSFLKILVGLVRPDSGSARVFDLDALDGAQSIAIRRRIGFLPGDVGFYAGWTGRRWLAFQLALHPAADLDEADALAEEFEIPLDRKIKTYSSGMRQKLGVVSAFASGAELLLLDEPTRGLDPTSQEQFIARMLLLKERGATIVLSSHALNEIERACDRIEFIAAGRRVDPSVIAKARNEFRTRVRAGIPLGDAEFEARVGRLSGVLAIRRDGTDLVIDVADVGAALPRLLEIGATSLEYNRPSLEDLYRRLYLPTGEMR